MWVLARAFALLVCLTLTGCYLISGEEDGGDDPTAPDIKEKCGPPGARSTGPCPQEGTDCARNGGVAVATCLPDGSFDTCMCVAPSDLAFQNTGGSSAGTGAAAGGGGVSMFAGMGGAAGAEGMMPPIQCGSVVCFDMNASLRNLVSQLLPAPFPCCADPAQALCGFTTESGACLPEPEVDPRCPAGTSPAGELAGCCAASNRCGLRHALFGAECMPVDELQAMLPAGLATLPPPQDCDGDADAGVLEP